MRYVLFFILLLGSKFSFADTNNLKAYEDSLQIYFIKLASEKNDIVKEELNEKIVSFFRKALNEDVSFEFNFSKLKYVGIIYSDSYDLRIITWNLPYNDRTYKYFGFIQYKKSKRKNIVFTIGFCASFGTDRNLL